MHFVNISFSVFCMFALISSGHSNRARNNFDSWGFEETTPNYWGDDAVDTETAEDLGELQDNLIPPQSDGMDDFVRQAILNCNSGSCYFDQKTTSCISAKVVQSVCSKKTAKDTANEAMDFVGSCSPSNAKITLKTTFNDALLCLKADKTDFPKLQSALGAVIIDEFQGPYDTAKAAATQYMQENPTATCSDQNVQAAIRSAFGQYLNVNTVDNFNSGFADKLSCDEAFCLIDHFDEILNLQPLAGLMNEKKQCGFKKDDIDKKK